MTEASADVMKTVSAEMGRILARPPLEPEADFFRLGGDSVRAVELIDSLSKRYDPRPGGEESPLAAQLLLAIFDEATPRGVASVITATAGLP